MARDPTDARPGNRRGPALAFRAFASALLVAFAAACCPVPLAGTTATPTAFVAIVAAADTSSWVAEGPGGARYRVAGESPAEVGKRVYLAGAFTPDGTLVVERADPLEIR